MIILDHLYFQEQLLKDKDFFLPCPHFQYNIPEHIISKHSIFKYIWFPENTTQMDINLLEINYKNNRCFNSNYKCYICSNQGEDLLKLNDYLNFLIDSIQNNNIISLVNKNQPDLIKFILFNWAYILNNEITIKELITLYDVTKFGLIKQLIYTSLNNQLLHLQQNKLSNLP